MAMTWRCCMWVRGMEPECTAQRWLLVCTAEGVHVGQHGLPGDSVRDALGSVLVCEEHEKLSVMFGHVADT